MVDRRHDRDIGTFSICSPVRDFGQPINFWKDLEVPRLELSCMDQVRPLQPQGEKGEKKQREYRVKAALPTTVDRLCAPTGWEVWDGVVRKRLE